ncbi:type VI secretion system ATPase TssH [Aureimonas sp. ME7]|uniref:type VI secretion system ATPase TssH n=1 Tax=Aureimonas sp. ME7 TaxID=2744252 RepID=UPI0015F46EE3|nr:type VI secretion system ATPase TssH [Aureimonas sp. ME7]
MSSIDLQNLVQRMSAPVRASLEGAAALAVRHTHDAIELHHWLGALALDDGFRSLLGDLGVSAKDFRAEIDREINTLPRGRGGTPAFSGNAISLAREAWMATSLGGGRAQIGFADLLTVLADDVSLRSLSRALCPSLRSLDTAKLAAERAKADEGERQAVGAARPAASATSGEDFLGAYTHDMTADARAGRIDPVVGREDELRQVVDILLRRRQNNPILVGEAGVGKTAVAEAFALRLVVGDVPERLRDTRLLSLDLSLLQAGAGVKGEFERRLTGVVDAVKSSPEPIILFIDEAHGLVGAGNQAGQGDAANILKPALARGELRTIAATTWGEYKRYFERDAALTRRFQPVKVGEPDEETAVRMLRGVVDILQSHHGVRIRDEALRAAVRLSARYIPARQLPDKAVSLIDTAAASVAFGRAAEPAALEDARREREHLQLEADRLSREPGDEDTTERAHEIARRLDALGGEIAALEARLEAERELIDEADRLEGEIETGDDEQDRRAAFHEAAGRLADAQGEAALIHRVVDAEAVAAVVSRWTGVPLGRLVSDQLAAVNELGSRLKSRIVGQDDALDRLADAMRVSRARLSDPRRPTGVFLMVGMSGVGKTETALALADLLYGGPQSLTTINMSEFKEEHKVSMLLGSPPGYVGFGEGGVLTEAVRRRPYGVLLLDEIDKAHPGVQDVFYQLFDKGSLRDGEGRDIDFRNTLILMTANTGSDVLQALSADPDTMPEGEALGAVLKDALLQEFKPAFLGRTVILPFQPLGADALAGIVDLQIGRVADRLAANYGASLDLSEAARAALVAGAAAGDTGARAIESAIARDLLPVLSAHCLDETLAGHKIRTVRIDHDGSGFVAAGPSSIPLAAQAVDRAPSEDPAPERWREAV